MASVFLPSEYLPDRQLTCQFVVYLPACLFVCLSECVCVNIPITGLCSGGGNSDSDSDSRYFVGSTMIAERSQ